MKLVAHKVKRYKTGGVERISEGPFETFQMEVRPMTEGRKPAAEKHMVKQYSRPGRSKKGY